MTQAKEGKMRVCCQKKHVKFHPYRPHSEGRPNAFYALKERVRELERSVKMLCEWREAKLNEEVRNDPS